MKILRFSTHIALALAFVFSSNSARAQGEINVRGYFGTTIPNGQINATGSNGSFLGTADSVDSAPITREFTIENTASQFNFLTLTGSPKVTVSGPHASDFKVTQPDAIFLPGETSTTFQVTFTPGGGGIRDATITIPNNDPDDGEAPYTFAIEAAVSRFHLSYGVTGVGSISGNASQNVLRSKSGSPVTAEPAPGHLFVSWSDGVTDNPRTDTDTTSDIQVTARFLPQDFLTYVSSGTEIMILGCDQSLRGSLAVPASIDGVPVTSIGPNAFYACGELTKIVIPHGVSTIWSGAFKNCTELVSISIPGSVTSIGSEAFYRCFNLTDITIPGNVTEIRDWTFHNCTRLTNVILPEGVTDIGDYAFSGCQRLKELLIPTTVERIGASAFSFCLALESITIPEGVISIEEAAFGRCTSLTEVTIPLSLTSIGNYAFSSCEKLASITIPRGVTSIGTAAFVGCSSLTSFIVDSQNTHFSSEGAILFNKDKTELRSYPAVSGHFTIPPGVSTISASAFQACDGLTSVTISEGVTSIGGSAFQYCNNLGSVTIPEGVASIGIGAFWECPNLTDVVLEGDAPSLDSEDRVLFFRSPVTSLVIADPDAKGYVYGGRFGGLPVTGLDPNADPYGTGVSNLLTYAFFGPDRDPATVSSSQLPRISPRDGSLHISFTPPSVVSGVIFCAEWTSTIGESWQELSDTDANPEVYEFSVPMDGGRKFMRLKVREE